MRALMTITALPASILVTNTTLAEQQRVGDWTVDVSRSYAEAFTGNDSGSTFGLICLTGTCLFYLDNSVRCKENSKTPMLINADSGATYVIATCLHLTWNSGGTRYVYTIQDKDVVTAISSGATIGFAMPLESGQFKVTRFSLSGALRATHEAAQTIPTRRDTGLRDSTM